jgi:hypothetical protein
VDAVEDDVRVALRPELCLHVDPVHEEDADEIRLREVVSCESVRGAHRVDPLGRVAPRLAVERDVADRPAECAVHELRACRNPTVDVRASEVAALEPRLTGPDGVEVRTVEAAFAEDALPSARKERLQTLVEELAAEVAALEDATVRREALECGAAEIRVADRDSIEREDALHGLGLRVCLVRLRRPPRAG